METTAKAPRNNQPYQTTAQEIEPTWEWVKIPREHLKTPFKRTLFFVSSEPRRADGGPDPEIGRSGDVLDGGSLAIDFADESLGRKGPEVQMTQWL